MPIHWAIIKYGLHNFIFSKVQSFSNEADCLKAETYWIRYFKSRNENFGYNLTEGGEGSSGFKLSQESKDKISKANKGLKRTDLFKITRSNNMLGTKNHFYGKTHSEKVALKSSGENSKSSKLKSTQIVDIINLFENKTYNQTQLAQIYGVSQQHISRIINKLRRVRG